jgi:Icc-related predicted phosphoesterase
MGMRNMSIKFLYATDLHGNVKKYQTVLRTAKKLGIQTIHLGADILPKGPDLLHIQKEFVHGFLKEFFKKCQNEGIQVLCFFGNDDIYCFKDDVRKYNNLLDENPVEINGYEFKAYGYVSDYPFALKTGCKLNYPDEVLKEEAYISDPVCVNKKGLYYIKDVKKYFREKGTIEEDLQSLSSDPNTIIAFHCPPAGNELDVCGTLIKSFVSEKLNIWLARKTVGSEPILRWIERNQPKLVLCGHIHESFAVTKKWKTLIGNTLVIQPGQLNGVTTMVKIEVGEQVQCELIQRINYEKTTRVAVKKRLDKI